MYFKGIGGGNILHQVSSISIIVRIMLALILGGILGLERGRKNQAAGFRTYMLVCLGATMVMITGQYIFQTYNVGDPARMAAQVVSGIGFLGAGSIIVTGRNQIRGLTTAAGLWTAACIGIAIGIGFYEGAIMGSITVFMIMTLFQKIEGFFRANNKFMNVYIEFDEYSSLSKLIEFSRTEKIQVVDVQISNNNLMNTDGVAVIMYLKNTKRQEHSIVIGILSNVKGVRYIEEI